MLIWGNISNRSLYVFFHDGSSPNPRLGAGSPKNKLSYWLKPPEKNNYHGEFMAAMEKHEISYGIGNIGISYGNMRMGYHCSFMGDLMIIDGMEFTNNMIGVVSENEIHPSNGKFDRENMIDSGIVGFPIWKQLYKKWIKLWLYIWRYMALCKNRVLKSHGV